ncbi:hypothetical protein A11A3_11598 [Alcanivorax hongdengensis A-11-3]|uniref:Lipoprotein n=1 Tax=Alcanivorax hongdengensis A-11-3 TaxID=1177179 RepID=L0WA55_9GAMM|nr:hypothetical protein [Alcanivorax hongdengensis]EKF73851.1 hypothetical protein A11A3_11598 [Alcanivorax hongdengensis A-11-3]
MRRLSTLLLAGLLAACGGGEVSAPDLAEGSYTGAVTLDGQLYRFTAFYDADGGAEVLLNGEQEKTTALARRSSRLFPWQGVALQQAVLFASQRSARLTALNADSQAGDYRTLLDDTPLSLTLTRAGRFAGRTEQGCLLVGHWKTRPLAEARKVGLTLLHCGERDGHYRGVLFADPYQAPALHLVADNGTAIVDLLLQPQG